MDPRADLGRIERQQLFIREAVNGLLHDIESSPFSAGDTIAGRHRLGADRSAARPDQGRAGAAQGRPDRGSTRTPCPVYNDTVGDAAVLRLGDGADSLLAYFRGEGPAPTQFETTTDPALVAAAVRFRLTGLPYRLRPS